ncbi:hypothetical protein [Planctomicrobium piriforme]|uniref:Dolichyl-phosphate-mannose-protein mannosyltransferase n=1 Tax=Planctomicrobium piriforme TaxID=1576369 RepID=A0A1I3FCD0_9PLAN|nr:hypothetical protein [Planctomicrobium piriforme]SFI08804.1 hypothetical protein SAMN05421753_105173 [Planctomicrobium piriforme]
MGTRDHDPALGRQPGRVAAWAGLLVMVAIGGAGLAVTGRLQAVPVNDTPSYQDFSFQTWQGSLDSIRTPLFPLLLKTVEAATGSLAAMPTVHFLLFAAAVLVFHAGLLANGCSSARSAVIAGSLLISNILWGYVSTLATDTVAAAAGVAVLGAILLVAGTRQRGFSNWWLWLLLSILVTVGWLLRPANLFLVPLTMIAVPMLQVSNSLRLRGWRSALRSFLITSTVVCVPLLAYCGLRSNVVGKFGIVSFGGYNLIGVTGQFLDAELVPQLPADLQPLANAALARKTALPADEFPLPHEPRLHYMRMEVGYDVYIWKLFVPAAQEVSGNNAAAVNTQLKQLGAALAILRPRDYVTWLLKAARQALFKLLGDFTLNYAGGPMMMGTAVLAILATLRKWSNPAVAATPEGMKIINILFCLVALYAGLSLLLVILVCPPLGRMTDAAAIGLAPLVVAAFCEFTAQLLMRPSEERRPVGDP